MKKRGRFEIIYDILCIIQDHDNSIKPTPLLRYTNISSNRFYGYYNELIKKELIAKKYDGKKKKYITLTDKGFKYIEKYKLFMGIIEEFEL